MSLLQKTFKPSIFLLKSLPRHPSLFMSLIPFVLGVQMWWWTPVPINSSPFYFELQVDLGLALVRGNKQMFTFCCVPIHKRAGRIERCPGKGATGILCSVHGSPRPWEMDKSDALQMPSAAYVPGSSVFCSCHREVISKQGIMPN